VVTQTFASWNQLSGWLRQLDGLRAFADQPDANTYSHVLPALQADAAAKLNAILDNVSQIIGASKAR
jgi:hypothetical protein